MTTQCQGKLQDIAERVREGRYEIDPAAVAEAVVGRMSWDLDLGAGAPEQADPVPATARPSGRPRLRGIVRLGGPPTLAASRLSRA